ncbi:MAG TPA: hypothetical protein PKH24_09980 [Sedimentisphaerales bacterium]|jgi:hypothetical protein|nr:hypothetical protein [Sedimentisphaerales bacterium]HNU28746.1 hypothetical protein [Sedimentisphaerales bacterium]
MQARLMVIALVAFQTVSAVASSAEKVELLGVRKIWDQAPHNAFTDLVRWQDQFYCAFREGRGHVSADGKVRVIRSQDGDTWTSSNLAELAGYDLRDAHLSITPDNRLMLLGGAAPREKDGQGAPTGSFVAFSKDGVEWTKPQIVVEPGRWLWSVTWHKGKAYGVAYPASERSPDIELLTSADGITWQSLVPKLYGVGFPNEVALRFDANDVCYALVRRDRQDNAPHSAILGISKGDYTKWDWFDLGTEFNGFGGPSLIQLPTGQWFAAGRMHEGGAHTALCQIDMAEHKMTKLLKLPSGGDTSYPGLVWHNGLLYVSYYSSHEGKTSIYLAKIKIGL